MRLFVLMLLITASIVSGCGEKHPEGATLAQSTEGSPLQENEKKVIVIMIDSMTKPVLEKSIDSGLVPALSFLIDHGSTFHDLLAPFPSMSVTIESSLVTGESPRYHEIPGLKWYNQETDAIIDYASSLEMIWKLGANDTLMNVLHHLNNDHLSKQTETIYEALNKKGYSTGSINLLVYRGNTTHSVDIPNYLTSAIDLPKKITTKGPDLLVFGDAIQPKVVRDKNVKAGPMKRYGLMDHFSSTAISTLIKEKEQPDFLLAFFPDYDKDAHHHGPVSPDYFAKADFELQKIFNAFDSWEQALEETIFVILGDHGQVKLNEHSETAAIELDLLVAPYHIAPLLDEPSSGDLIVANNHRSAYLYLQNEELTYSKMSDLLRKDSRIDHVAWLDEDGLVLQKVGTEGVLHVHEGGRWKDQYGQNWTIAGNPDVADISFHNETSSISYGDYPDIFHQLLESLTSHNQQAMVVTAKVGHTLKTEGAPVHRGGGEHGGLHKDDTLASIIIAGTNIEPKQRRMKDLKEFFISLLEDQS